MFQQIASFLYNYFWPPIPPAAPPPPPLASRQFLGYCWQPGQGVPGNLIIFDGSAAPGVYVGFGASQLVPENNCFGRNPVPGGPGPVFIAPPAPSAAVTQIINQVNANPPPSEADDFSNVTQERLQDISGFLEYANTCLTIINSTAAGTELFNRINATAHPVIIIACQSDNQTFPGRGQDYYLNTLTQNLLNYVDNQLLDSAAIADIIAVQYAALALGLPQYNQLAADLNGMTLYSLFEDPAQSAPTFLDQNFLYMGQPITGQNLMDWLSPDGSVAFNLNVLTFAGNVQGVWVKQYFLMALIIALYNNTPANSGAGSYVYMNVVNAEDNQQGNPNFRPPAIGLAHELMHAMHYAEGNATGITLYNFSTTAAELLFTGIGPFASQPVSENAVREQWNTIPAAVIDPSNVWNNPGLRIIYAPPPPGYTLQQMRTLRQCI
jgi:hypothetical protein